MKKIILVLLVSILFTSCENWLDVKPFDSMEVEKVFPDERTTNSALNGIYVNITRDELYGRDLSCGMLEVMAQHFVVPSQASPEHTYRELNDFNYTSEKPKELLGDSFKYAYQTIADCNEFLAQVRNGAENYTTEKLNLYYGEALALRTLLHFDMMRLFGPMGTEKERSSVPYYSESTNNAKPILTASAMIDSLLVDIDLSINYLKNDPVLTGGVMTGKDQTINFFNSFRNFRMNYYAVNALKARILLYKGDEASLTAAYQIATNLIEGKDPQNASKSTNFNNEFEFRRAQLSDVTEQVYFSELIFANHNTARQAVFKLLFSSELDNNTILGGGKAFHENLYGVSSTALGGLDPGPRRTMWKYDDLKNLYEFNRLAVYKENINFPYHTQVQSMIRMGELYLIAAETAPSVELKRSWVEKLRTGKGYDPGNADGLTEAQLNTLIGLEFEKETYGEGQYFFYAKRKAMNLRNQNNATVTMDRAKFVPPLPNIESDYRTSETDL